MQIKATDIGRASSAAAIIYAALRDAIIEGRLSDGEALRQDEIARLFGASRIPVREALIKLEQQGLVRTERFRGTYVTGISPGEAGEIFDFRALVEGHVIGRAVPRMSPETLQSARAHLVAFSETDDPREWGRRNRMFHMELYRPSGLTYHLSVIDNAFDRVDRYLRAQLALTNGQSRATKEHDAILDACEKGEAELASYLTQRHILGAKTALIANLPTG